VTGFFLPPLEVQHFVENLPLGQRHFRMLSLS
jgi:hypothetical protein